MFPIRIYIREILKIAVYSGNRLQVSPVVIHTARTAAMNVRTFAVSFFPGADSTPLETSTPNGFTLRTASATFSGVKPPARKIGLPNFCASMLDIFFRAKGILQASKLRRSLVSAQALRNLLFRQRRFILDKIPLHPGLFGGAHKRREWNLAFTDWHIIGHVRMTGEKPGGRAFLHAFEVHELPALAVFFQKLHRVLTRVNDPKYVHLETDGFRIGLGHHQIEESAVLVRLKLIAVCVVKKNQAMPGKDFARVIEHRNRFAAGLFIERFAMRNPSAADRSEGRRVG